MSAISETLRKRLDLSKVELMAHAQYNVVYVEHIDGRGFTRSARTMERAIENIMLDLDEYNRTRRVFYPSLPPIPSAPSHAPN